jgi:hypothetical protein
VSETSTVVYCSLGFHEENGHGQLEWRVSYYLLYSSLVRIQHLFEGIWSKVVVVVIIIFAKDGSRHLREGCACHSGAHFAKHPCRLPAPLTVHRTRHGAWLRVHLGVLFVCFRICLLLFYFRACTCTLEHQGPTRIPNWLQCRQGNAASLVDLAGRHHIPIRHDPTVRSLRNSHYTYDLNHETRLGNRTAHSIMAWGMGQQGLRTCHGPSLVWSSISCAETNASSDTRGYRKMLVCIYHTV